MRRSEKQKVVSSREGMFSHAVSQLELPTAIATGFDIALDSRFRNCVHSCELDNPCNCRQAWYAWYGMVWYGMAWGLMPPPRRRAGRSSWGRRGGREVRRWARTAGQAAQAGDVARAGGGAAEASSEAAEAEAAEAEAVGAVGAAGGSGGGGPGPLVESGEASPPAVDKGLRH